MKRLSFISSSLAKNFFLYFTSTLILALLFLAQSCKSPTAPKTNSPPDTTSNNFTFQTFTLGSSNAGSSYLQDVAVISDSDIWCVGAVYLDSTDGNPDPFPYNAVHWDGKKWQLIKIAVQTKYGIVTTPLEGVFAFSSNDIWLVAGDPIHGDGKNWIDYDIRDITGDQSVDVSKGWGANSNSMYFVGQTGNIIQYNNGVWQEIESGTTTSITDIWGSGDTILATVTNEYETGNKKLLQINTNGTVDSLNWSPNSRLQTVWFQSIDKIFIGGGKNIVGKPNNWQEITDIPAYYSERVRGNAPNDVFFVGAFGLCAHYNGSSWKTYNELYNPDESLLGLAVKGNIMVAVGQVGNKAVIISGYR